MIQMDIYFFSLHTYHSTKLKVFSDSHQVIHSELLKNNEVLQLVVDFQGAVQTIHNKLFLLFCDEEQIKYLNL